MNDSACKVEYSAIAWNEKHHYSLLNGQLVYRFQESDTSFSLNAEPGTFTLRPHWQTHRKFREGLALFAIPSFSLAFVYAREHTFTHLGAMLYLLLGLMVVGVALLTRYRSIYRGYMLRTRSGDELFIFRDPKNPERADEFISRLEHRL